MEVSGNTLLIAGAFPDAALRPNLSKTFSRDHTEYPTGYWEEAAKLWTVGPNICLNCISMGVLISVFVLLFTSGFSHVHLPFKKPYGIPSLHEVRNWRESSCRTNFTGCNSTLPLPSLLPGTHQGKLKTLALGIFWGSYWNWIALK